MTVDRRHFLLAGGTLAGSGLASAAYAATATGPARSVLDFGVVPNLEKDQTEALQTAIDELSRALQPIVLPSGEYRARKLILPNWCSVIGVPGQTSLKVDEITTRPGDDLLGLFVLFGLSFQSKSTGIQLTAGGPIRIANCGFYGGGKTALRLDGSSGTLEASNFQHYSAEAVSALRSELKISGCQFSDCGRGIALSSGRGGAIIAQNQFDRCGIGVVADGTGIVNGNIVKDAKEFGLKLGRADGNGRIVAQGNLLENCRIGIGVTASGDDIFASLNLIHGAKDGAIRAFDGDKLVGRDLARESAEVYLNLTVAGNVAR